MICTNLECNENVDKTASLNRCYECEILDRITDDGLDIEFAAKYQRVLNRIKQENYMPRMSQGRRVWLYVTRIRHHLLGRIDDMPTITKENN